MRTFKGFSTVNKEYGNFKLYDLELARQDLLNQLYTRKGSRLMSPKFGCIVWDLLFDPLLTEVIEKIRADVIRIVSEDPRWKLINLDISESVDQQTLSVSMVLYYVSTATTIDLIATYQRNISSDQLQN
jgi:phage baseplate assembly protein W